MTRNDFMRSCSAGVCSCAALAWMAPQPAAADSDDPDVGVSTSL